MSGVLACVRVDSDGSLVALGSRKGTCADCGAAVWIAPSGIRLIATKGLASVCMLCTAVRLAGDPAPEFMEITDEQRAEAEATLRGWDRPR